jgi:hypothetical protein
LDLIEREMVDGEAKYGPFKTPSQAYAILLHEMLDLHWYMKREEAGDGGNAVMEWAQIAAVALRELMQFSRWDPVS